VKTLLWKIFFICFMIVTMLIYPVYMLFKLLLPAKIYYRMVQWVVRNWGRVTILSTGSRVSVTGQENLPEKRNICFISNHQGMFDIPLVLGFIGIPTGFISKQELFKIPVISHWMREIPCTFIDRESPRKAMESFQRSAEMIKAGHPMVIFPEGTRSRSDNMGEFHLGSLKLPMMANATIVPIAISGSWRMMEINRRIHAVYLQIKILKPITPDNELYHDKHRLLAYLHETISTALTQA